MLRIRLKRTGRKHINTFRVIVINAKKPRDSGAHVDNLGYYHPQNKKNMININIDKYNAWILKGALPSSTVAKLVKIQNAKQN